MLGVGALLAIIAAGVAGAVTQPAGKKLNAIAERLAESGGSAPPPAATVDEIAALQARSSRGLTIMSILLLLSAAAMSVARYL